MAVYEDPGFDVDTALTSTATHLCLGANLESDSNHRIESCLRIECADARIPKWVLRQHIHPRSEVQKVGDSGKLVLSTEYAMLLGL